MQESFWSCSDGTSPKQVVVKNTRGCDLVANAVQLYAEMFHSKSQTGAFTASLCTAVRSGFGVSSAC